MKDILTTKVAKSTKQLMKIHEAQVLTYMKLANVRIGLLINF